MGCNRFIVRRGYLVMVDLGIVLVSFVLAGLVRFESTFDIGRRFGRHESLLWVSLLVYPLTYLTFGLYHRLWRYASLPDTVRIVLASLAGMVLIYGINFFVLPAAGLPSSNSNSIFLLSSLLNLLFLASHRLGRRIYWSWQRYRRRPPVQTIVGNRLKTLVVGADDLGELIVRHIKRHPELGAEVVGFVDDNAAMHNMRIHNVPILGGYRAMPRLVRQYDVDEVIIADANSQQPSSQEIVRWCRSHFIPVKTYPSLPEVFNGLINQTHGQPELPSEGSLVFENLLVTGGAGFIGANFVHYMLDAHPNYRIVVYDNLTYAGNLDNLRGLAEKYGDRYSFACGDITKPDVVASIMEQYKIDGIINFAAETHVDRSLMDPGSFVDTNVKGSCVLLDQAHQFGVQRYHQISTDEVYGQIFQGSFRESDPLDCRSPYSASKGGSDMMALAYFTSFDLPVTISRGSNNIGPFQHVEKVVPLFTTNAIDDLPLPLYGDGLYERDYQYVRDNCQGIDLVLHRGRSGEVYNLGAGQEMNALDLALKICDILGKPHSLIHFVEDRPGQDRRYSLDCSKVIALGWRPKHTPDQAIEKTVRWYVENEWWWRKVKQGEYQEYYRRQYGERLKHATRIIATPVVAPLEERL